MDLPQANLKFNACFAHPSLSSLAHTCPYILIAPRAAVRKACALALPPQVPYFVVLFVVDVEASGPPLPLAFSMSRASATAVNLSLRTNVLSLFTELDSARQLPTSIKTSLDRLGVALDCGLEDNCGYEWNE